MATFDHFQAETFVHSLKKIHGTEESCGIEWIGQPSVVSTLNLPTEPIKREAQDKILMSLPLCCYDCGNPNILSRP